MLIPQEGPNQDLPTLTVRPGLVLSEVEAEAVAGVAAVVVVLKAKVVLAVAERLT